MKYVVCSFILLSDCILLRFAVRSLRFTLTIFDLGFLPYTMCLNIGCYSAFTEIFLYVYIYNEYKNIMYILYI